jgi:hypothetical protein
VDNGDIAGQNKIRALAEARSADMMAISGPCPGISSSMSGRRRKANLSLAAALMMISSKWGRIWAMTVSIRVRPLTGSSDFSLRMRRLWPPARMIAETGSAFMADMDSQARGLMSSLAKRPCSGLGDFFFKKRFRNSSRFSFGLVKLAPME